jgi:hypothetical protein
MENAYDINATLNCQIHNQVMGMMVYAHWRAELAALAAL